MKHVFDLSAPGPTATLCGLKHTAVGVSAVFAERRNVTNVCPKCAERLKAA
jgi:hypothetical protein